MDGINVQYKYLTEEIVKKVHDDKKYIGLWCPMGGWESPEMMAKVFTHGGGVDFFFSNSPVEAMLYRDSIQ